MAKKKKKELDFSPETVRKKRKFPILNTILLVVCIVLQIVAVVSMVSYDPQPLDVIEKYEVTVVPLDDGTLDVTYYLRWTPLSAEPLTWIEIGMANEDFYFYDDESSESVSSLYKDVGDGYCYTKVYLSREYTKGETFDISFKVNQKRMLCQHGGGYFYEFVPGWFNATPVEEYTFKWKIDENGTPLDAHLTDEGYAVWSGNMECGSYQMMRVEYPLDSFIGANTVAYSAFDPSGAYNEMHENKSVAIFVGVLVIILFLVAQLFIVDSYVSYSRGRGFMRGYGYHVHTYGSVNPHYRTAARRANSSHGGSHGGGCACACACACAGGGRAGCSQKDTYSRRIWQRSGESDQIK